MFSLIFGVLSLLVGLALSFWLDGYACDYIYKHFNIVDQIIRFIGWVALLFLITGPVTGTCYFIGITIGVFTDIVTGAGS